MKYHPEFVDEFTYNEERYVKLKIKGIEINLHILGQYNEISIFKKYFTELFTLILPLTKTPKSIVNIRLYYIPKNKYLPKQNEFIESKHINSGYYIIDTINIVIYRQEEFYKVLTHELLHFFDVIPFSYELQSMYENIFKSVKNTINVNEGLVEVNALILNCYIVSKLRNLNFNKLLQSEYKFSEKQVSKLLLQQNVSFNDILNDKFVWKENTNAFSYFILKHIFLYIYMKKRHEIKLPLPIKSSDTSIKMTLTSM